MKKFNKVVLDGVELVGNGEYYVNGKFIRIITRAPSIKKALQNKLRDDTRDFMMTVIEISNNGDSFITRGEYVVINKKGNEFLIENLK